MDHAIRGTRDRVFPASDDPGRRGRECARRRGRIVRFTPALIVAIVAIAAVVVLSVFGTLASTDAAGLIATVIAGFGLGNSHANSAGNAG